MGAEERTLPKHIAIIMDGNGRWAKAKGMPRLYGHNEGVKTVRKILKEAKNIGIKYLTLYAFSTENWRRSELEVKGLMKLFKEYLKKERKELMLMNVKLVFSGSKDGVSDSLWKEMKETEEYLSGNNGITMNIAFNYGGRREIVEAVKRIIESGEKDINEYNFYKYLYQPEIPDPELIIRTSGEFRTSNFLLWESAYSEYCITEKLWPEFNEEDLRNAVESYKKRERRFGGA
jgi:undecaprenyl diphosphate synthase